MTSPNAERNILFLMVDDGGFEPQPLGGAVETPWIAALANRSTVFERAHTTVSSCSPSRAAVLSGLPSHQNGMYGLHQFPGNFQSHRDVTSVPNLLNAAGYKTGIVGKHHVGPLDAYAFGYGTSNKYCWAAALGNPQVDPPTGCSREYNDATRNVSAMAGRARTFLREIEPAAPFFLYVGFGDVHRCGFGSPLGSFCERFGAGGVFGTIPGWSPRAHSPSEVRVPPFLPDTSAVRRDLVGYYTAWGRLDAGVGMMLREVERAGAAETTLTILFSDNGVPFPSGKTNLYYEQGTREPLLIARPGVEPTRGRSWLKMAPNLYESTAPWLTPAYLEAWRAPARPGA